MEKKGMHIILSLLLLLCPNIVKAASSCSYSEQAKLNDIAANVKGKYEHIERVAAEKAIDPDSGEEMEDWEDIFKISIINITENIYINVSNRTTGFEATYKYENTNNGVVEFEQNDLSKVSEYEIKVYSNNPNCTGELVRTFTLKTPMLNSFANIAICSSYPNYYYCQEFLDTEVEIDYEKFYDGLESYKSLHKEETTENTKKENKFIKFYKEHALVINVTLGACVAIGVATTVILVKRKRSRVL